jgi:hypothetical protein
MLPLTPDGPEEAEDNEINPVEPYTFLPEDKNRDPLAPKPPEIPP